MALEEPTNLTFETDEESINQNLNSKISKKGGPYTKIEREKRRQEVHRLHFEYGFSANKIADLMKINRNTITGDIKFWYSEIAKNNTIFNPEYIIGITTERLDLQRTRLREYLDTVSTVQEKLSIERMIFEIDSKLTLIHQKIAESSKRVYDLKIQCLNEHMKSTNQTDRYISSGDVLRASEAAQQKIKKIFEEDGKNFWSRQN